jgi:branched-chain amino acid transport system permease protein
MNIEKLGAMSFIPAIWMSAIVYASEITILSIGFTLTYLTAKIPNFAHGTYAGIGIYIAFTLSKIYSFSPYVGFPVSFVLGGLASVLIYLLVINVLSRLGGGGIVLTIATLAIQIFMTAAIYIYAYFLNRTFSRYAMGFMLKEEDFKLGGYQGIFPVSFAICIVTVIILHFLIKKTKMGVAMRATSEDLELSAVLGINTNRIQIFSWFLTGGLACLAGAMIPMWFMSSPSSGAAMITSIMAGSLLGGLENIYGAIFGGFGVGMSEILVTAGLQQVVGAWVGEWRPLVPMVILVAVLLLEPRGLNGVYERFKASRQKRVT